MGVGILEDGGGNVQSVCPNVIPGGDVGTDVIQYSLGEEPDGILREELGRSNIISTPKRAAWPTYTKRRGSVLNGQEGPLCKAVIFDVASGSGTVGGVELARENVTDPSEGVPESFVTSGSFSNLEGIARRQADDGFVGTRMGDEGEGMVRVAIVDEMFGQEAAPKDRTRYYPGQSVKRLLKDYFEMNPPTPLDPSHPTARRFVEDLLLKASGGSRTHPVTSRYHGGRSPFPSVAGSSMGDCVVCRSVYSLPTITETEGTDVIVAADVVEKPCSSRQADARLAMGTESSERPETDSLKTLQQIKSSQKKEKSRSCKWSREGRLNPFLPSGDDKGGYVFTEEMLERALFFEVFATGPDDPLENKYCFYCMLCRQNISMRTRGLYEPKRHFQRECHFWADQRFREKYCPGKVRGRDRRELYGSKLEAEREFYVELDVPDLDFKMSFYYDVLEGKPFTFTAEESRVRIQINLLMTFLKSGGKFWALEDCWTHVGIASGHSAAIADFNWCPAHISVRVSGFSQIFLVAVVSLCFGQFVGPMTRCCPSFLFFWGLRRILCPGFHHVLFQSLLHHCFIFLLKHIAVELEREKVYSLKFTTTSDFRKLSISFWEGKELITMTIALCGRDVPAVRSCVLL